MNRRSVLKAMVVSGGASSLALGTGAFTSVSADRDISVNVAGDNSAFLRMTPVVHEIEESDPATVYETGIRL